MWLLWLLQFVWHADADPDHAAKREEKLAAPAALQATTLHKADLMNLRSLCIKELAMTRR